MAQWAAAGSATSPSTVARAAIFVRVTAIMLLDGAEKDDAECRQLQANGDGIDLDQT